jgi:3-hydroxyisobutyrate dehydrogenase-like beta-hydroxyacid dehydrogenase
VPAELPVNRVGLVGVGVMGLAVAGKIVQAGTRSLAVHDVAPERRARAAKLDVAVCTGPADVADRSDLVLLLLPGPDEIEACVAGDDGLLRTARPGTIVVDHSTTAPESSERLAALARERGVAYLDAPVLGRPAAVGNWTLPVGGDTGALERCRPVLELYAKQVLPVGPPGSGNRVKLLNQLMFGAINAMTAEMMAVAERVGIPPRLLYETITSSRAGTVSHLFVELGKRVVADDYATPDFSVRLLRKDVRLAVEMARRAGATPLLGQTVQFLNELAHGHGLDAQDTAAMWQVFRRVWDDGGSAGRPGSAR